MKRPNAPYPMRPSVWGEEGVGGTDMLKDQFDGHIGVLANMGDILG
jgi:hypothetical protein